ncbi:hypothetical protein SADUNF_Sadunf16G0140600 [Salix dunnii]|uniref:RING-type domain-containing protein n=1 Tax=Salix dunnii TaxID=1413687 RepID=A0A835J9P1_9ROSI|nr:hypothetical protein SADUNF_Sadunf16G0140600 [Salix dunnii]
MEEPQRNEQHQQVPAATSSFASAPVDGPSTPPVSASRLVIEENQEEDDESVNIEGNSDGHHHDQEQERERPSSAVSYRLNMSTAAANQMRDDVWSCLAVLIAFWFFASLTIILGYYGSVSLELGPNCSRLVQPNPLFVQSLNAGELGKPKPGPILYGFHKPPPLDVEIIWTQEHDAAVPKDFHKANLSLFLYFFYKPSEWVLFLNKGSKVDISYSIKSPGASPLSLVIAQGTESLIEWIDDPSYPNTTLSWNIINGNGSILHEIPTSSTYYIAVGNLNSEEVKVELKFIVKSLIYDISQAYYSCPLSNHLCSLQLFLFGTTTAVLTAPGPSEGVSNEDWYVKLSYSPRWIIFIIGSGVMTALLLLALRLCNWCRPSGRDGYQAGEIQSERTRLLAQKDDDSSSWGSSYDSNSHEEEDLEKWLAVNCLEGKSVAEGENLRRLCVICFDALRDCFFLPCGHCAACFTCGTRIAEEVGACPICRRSLKKVRKIFTV